MAPTQTTRPSRPSRHSGSQPRPPVERPVAVEHEIVYLKPTPNALALRPASLHPSLRPVSFVAPPEPKPERKPAPKPAKLAKPASLPAPREKTPGKPVSVRTVPIGGTGPAWSRKPVSLRSEDLLAIPGLSRRPGSRPTKPSKPSSKPATMPISGTSSRRRSYLDPQPPKPHSIRARPSPGALAAPRPRDRPLSPAKPDRAEEEERLEHIRRLMAELEFDSEDDEVRELRELWAALRRQRRA